jgi:hypothetical protein
MCSREKEVLLIEHLQVMKQLNSLATLRVDSQPAPRRNRGLFGNSI